jgi:chromosome segregation ATPase
MKSEIALLQRQIKDVNKIKNDLNSNLKSRDMIIAEINLGKQENERKLNDTIQKFKNDFKFYKQSLIDNRREYDALQNRSRINNEEYREYIQKYKECIFNNKKLSDELELLKNKNQ